MFIQLSNKYFQVQPLGPYFLTTYACPLKDSIKKLLHLEIQMALLGSLLMNNVWSSIPYGSPQHASTHNSNL
jgi:hypothetical protein